MHTAIAVHVRCEHSPSASNVPRGLTVPDLAKNFATYMMVHSTMAESVHSKHVCALGICFKEYPSC